MAGRRKRTVIYEDQPYRRHNKRHYRYTYRDRHHRLCHRIIRPKYHFNVIYSYGSRWQCSWVYPYYHRRYVFVSLGGYWPVHYNYVRYYWYPAHYYDWYGYYPVAREVGGDTYNYYTYNYYDNQADTTAVADSTIPYADHTTYADVRERMQQQNAQPPAAQTTSDILFDEGVKAFEEGNYTLAADKFLEAMQLAPDDEILPFALAQALFAGGNYQAAADILRMQFKEVIPDEEGVYYPRGLYLDEEVLLAQIEQLEKAACEKPHDLDLQLLLGYQLLGFGQVEESIGPLNVAATDGRNANTVTVLLRLAEKIQSQDMLERD